MAPSARAQTPARGCLQQSIISAGAGCVMIPIVLGLIMVANSIPVGSPWEVVMIVGAPLALMGGLLSLGVGFWLWNRRRIARWLDAAMAPLGLDGQPYMRVGRQYHGVVQGRPVHARFQRGPSFSLAVECQARTRMSAAHGNALNRTVAGSSTVSHPTLEEHDVLFQARDEDHAQRLLSIEGVDQALVRLTDRQGHAWVRNLVVSPEAVALDLHRVGMGAITAESVQEWHRDLELLAQALDGLDDPSTVLSSSKLELELLRNPDAMRWMSRMIFAIIAVGLVATLLCSGLVGWAVVSFG